MPQIYEAPYFEQFKQAKMAQKNKDYLQAIEVYSDILAQSPEQVLAYIRRGDMYMAVKKYQEAIDDYSKALIWHSDDPIIYLKRGSAHYYFKKYQEAIDDYDAALSVSATCAPAYRGRGDAYADIGDYQQAVRDYNHAIRLEPSADNYNNRAIVYADVGYYDRAIDDYTKALEFAPNDAVVQANRGMVYLYMGDVRRAVLDCEKSLQFAPEFCYAHYCLGIAYTKLGKLESAFEHYNLAADSTCEELDENGLANVYVNRGIAKALNLNPPEQIRSDAEEGIKRNPEHVYAYLLLGDQSSGEEAIKNYSQAISFEPEYAVAYLKRGICYMKQGKTDEARADLEHARTLAINQIWRKQVEQKLIELEQMLAEEKPGSG